MNFNGNDIRSFVIKHYQYFVVGVLFIVLVIVLAIFSGHKKKDKDPAKEVTTAEQTAGDGAIEVPDVEFEVDAHPEVNELVQKYFRAATDGDTNTLLSICSELDETEQIRIEKKSDYIEGYDEIKCYSKPGPEANSYILFVYYKVKFKNISTPAPGLTSLYIRTKEDGSLYVYDGELSESVTNYIKAICAQDDVVNLLNEVDKEYGKAADSDEDLTKFMGALPTALDDAVASELAARADAQASAGDEGQSEGPSSVEAKVKETVNVRKSASTDAEKLGKVMGGDTITVVENLDNGWSRIDYQGEEGFVKSEFLEMSEGAPAASAENAEGGEQTAADNGGNGGDSVIGKVTAKERVRIRKGASTDSEQLGSADQGSTFELIMEQADGWCKIKYNGQTAYIKSDFVTIDKN